MDIAVSRHIHARPQLDLTADEIVLHPPDLEQERDVAFIGDVCGAARVLLPLL